MVGGKRLINSMGWLYSLSRHPIRRQYADQDVLEPSELFAHVSHLAGTIGPRPAGSAKARAACSYFADSLKQIGYTAHRQEYFLPDRSIAQNVWADKGGMMGSLLIVAVHADTVQGCPGANDDASGMAVALAIARKIAASRLRTGVRFLAVGAQEALLGGFVRPGFGALQFIQNLGGEERSRIAGIIWLDQLGAGPSLQIRYARGTDPKMGEMLSTGARHLGLRILPQVVRRWEPLMPFEDADFPTAWLEWWRDPYLHEARDRPERISLRKMQTAGAILYATLLDVNGLIAIPAEEWPGNPELVPTVAGSLQISARSTKARRGSG